jgi:hypothetical protein
MIKFNERERETQSILLHNKDIERERDFAKHNYALYCIRFHVVFAEHIEPGRYRKAGQD